MPLLFILLVILFIGGVPGAQGLGAVPRGQHEELYHPISQQLSFCVCTMQNSLGFLLYTPINNSRHISLPSNLTCKPSTTITSSPTFPAPNIEEFLEHMWEKISLNELEQKVITIHGNQLNVSNRLLVGRFIGKKVIPIQNLTLLLKKLWAAPNLKTILTGDGIYMFELYSREAYIKVYGDQSWHVGGVLFVVKIIDGTETQDDLQVSKVPFWVQLHTYQFFNTTEENGQLIGQAVGEVSEADIDRQIIAWGKFLRIRALIDVNKPICRWTNPIINGKRLFILFRYEKLVEYCFGCGRIDHMLKDCVDRFNEDGSIQRAVFRYPSWSRADGVGGVPFDELRRFLETSFMMEREATKGKAKVDKAVVPSTHCGLLCLEGSNQGHGASQAASSDSKNRDKEASHQGPAEDNRSQDNRSQPSMEWPHMGVKRARDGINHIIHASSGPVLPPPQTMLPHKERKQVHSFKDLKVGHKRARRNVSISLPPKARRICPRPQINSWSQYQWMPQARNAGSGANQLWHQSYYPPDGDHNWVQESSVTSSRAMVERNVHC